MTEKISIIVVDDHPLFREGVVMTLLESGHFDVVAQAGNKEQALTLAETVSYTHLTLPTIYSV